LNRPYLFTIAILIANFFVFLLMWHSSGMTGKALWVFPTPVLLAYGAKLNLLIDQQPHQWWRFVTPMFVHIDVLHLAVNMYSLWMLGPYVEKLYGSAKFVFFYVATGIAGVAASYFTLLSPDTNLGVFGRFIFKTQDVPSAGASGALFGLVGVLFVFGIKFRNELPEGFKRAFGTGLLPVIVLNLFIGFVGQRFIGNAAHLGGLFSGAALALLVGYRRPGDQSSMTIFWRVVQCAAIAIVLISFARIVQHFNDPLPIAQAEAATPAPDSKDAPFQKFFQIMNDSQEVFESAIKGDASGVDSAVAALENTQAPDIKSDQLRRKLSDLLQRAKLSAPTPQAAAKPDERRLELSKEFTVWTQDYNDWLKTFSKTN